MKDSTLEVLQSSIRYEMDQRGNLNLITKEDVVCFLMERAMQFEPAQINKLLELDADNFCLTLARTIPNLPSTSRIWKKVAFK